VLNLVYDHIHLYLKKEIHGRITDDSIKVLGVEPKSEDPSGTLSAPKKKGKKVVE
jgi:hypothetical protein